MITLKSVYSYLVHPRQPNVTSSLSLPEEMSYKNCHDLVQSSQDTPLVTFFSLICAISSRDCSVTGTFQKARLK